jgi:hypothetical protein
LNECSECGLAENTCQICFDANGSKEVTARETAIGDQHWAEINANLTGLVDAYRGEDWLGDDYVARLDGWAEELADPQHCSTLDMHVKTLANLLAAAIARLVSPTQKEQPR